MPHMEMPAQNYPNRYSQSAKDEDVNDAVYGPKSWPPVVPRYDVGVTSVHRR